jgi:hypothetical protein
MSDHITINAQILEKLGNIDGRLSGIEKAVTGNGQPGLAQKVADLEAYKNKQIGILTVLGALVTSAWGFLEYLFHYRGGK